MFFRLLSGVKKHFIFQHHDGKVSVRNNVVVTHLTSVSLRGTKHEHCRCCTRWGRGVVCLFFFFSACFVLQNCLHSVLEHIAVYGQAVFRLQRFIDEVTGHSSEPCPPGSGSSQSYRKGSEPPFRTYQAFVWALNKHFTSFKEELTTIEREVISNGKYDQKKNPFEFVILNGLFVFLSLLHSRNPRDMSYIHPLILKPFRIAVSA